LEDVALFTLPNDSEEEVDAESKIEAGDHEGAQDSSVQSDEAWEFGSSGDDTDSSTKAGLPRRDVVKTTPELDLQSEEEQNIPASNVRYDDENEDGLAKMDKEEKRPQGEDKQQREASSYSQNYDQQSSTQGPTPQSAHKQQQQFPPAPSPGSASSPYRWFVAGDGIRRDVIEADIQRYLGPEALVRPGIDSNGKSGYWIAAYRTLTTVGVVLRLILLVARF